LYSSHLDILVLENKLCEYGPCETKECLFELYRNCKIGEFYGCIHDIIVDDKRNQETITPISRNYKKNRWKRWRYDRYGVTFIVLYVSNYMFAACPDINHDISLSTNNSSYIFLFTIYIDQATGTTEEIFSIEEEQKLFLNKQIFSLKICWYKTNGVVLSNKSYGGESQYGKIIW
jgi:hypothetical protein